MWTPNSCCCNTTSPLLQHHSPLLQHHFSLLQHHFPLLQHHLCCCNTIPVAATPLPVAATPFLVAATLPLLLQHHFPLPQHYSCCCNTSSITPAHSPFSQTFSPNPCCPNGNFLLLQHQSRCHDIASRSRNILSSQNIPPLVMITAPYYHFPSLSLQITHIPVPSDPR